MQLLRHVLLQLVVLAVPLLAFGGIAYPPDFPWVLGVGLLISLAVYWRPRRAIPRGLAFLLMLTCLFAYAIFLRVTTVQEGRERFQIGFGMADWSLQEEGYLWKHEDSGENVNKSPRDLMTAKAAFDDAKLPSLWRYRWVATAILSLLWCGFCATLGAVLRSFVIAQRPAANLPEVEKTHLNSRPIEDSHVPASGSNSTSPPVPSQRIELATNSTTRRFDIALSFPGERRDFVARVAEALVTSVKRDRILYDKYYEAEFARMDLDVYLTRLYREQSELVVVFLCPEYQQKRWCNLEWRHIRQLIATADSGRIMLLSFGNPGDLSEIGILPGDGYADIGNRDPETIAALILQRFRGTN